MIFFIINLIVLLRYKNNNYPSGINKKKSRQIAGSFDKINLKLF